MYFPPSERHTHFSFSVISYLIHSFLRKTQRRTAPREPCPGSQVTWCWPCTWSAAWSSCCRSSTFSAKCSTARPAAAQVPPSPTTPQTPPSTATRRATSWRARKCSGVERGRTSRRWWKKTFSRDSSRREDTAEDRVTWGLTHNWSTLVKNLNLYITKQGNTSGEKT